MFHHDRLRRGLLLWSLISVFLFPLVTVKGGWSAATTRMDGTLRRALELRSDVTLLSRAVPGITVEHGEAHVNVFLEFDRPPSEMNLDDYGVDLRSRAGNVYMGRIPVRNLEEVASLPGVVRLEGDARVSSFLNLSVPEIGADRVWRDSRYGNLRGEGVVVGMVDTGISLRHENFLEEGGGDTSRVLYVWDMGDPSGPAPDAACKDYTVDPPQPVECGGTECSPLSDTCRQEDDEGHGTGVMGVAAGNGQADCGEDLPCSGVAPRAGIVVVKMNRHLASEVIQGVDYIFQKAAALGKPAVVNLSVGWYKGSRDGNSLLERYVSNLAGPGRIIVTSAGNNALEMDHARMEVLGSPVRRTLWIECRPSPGQWADIYGWYDAPGSGSVEVRVLNYDENVATPWVGFGGEETLDSRWGRITIQHAETSGDARGFTVTLESGSSPLRAGQWHVEARGVDLSQAVRVDLWVERTLVLGPNDNCMKPIRFVKAQADKESTVAPPCTSDGVICVGSYNTRCLQGFCTGCSLDYPKSNNCIDGQETAGDISSFSCLGPTRDGDRQPWLSAPGQAILLPDNRGTGTYSYASGTSFAAPHVAGVVALMLQANPNLSPAQVREALRGTARLPEGVSVWDEAWGWGMVDAYGAVAEVASEIPPPPPPKPHGLGEGDDLCFIATASFGDIRAVQVDRIREIRDRFLVKTRLGRRFVRSYYRWSPPVAAWIRQHPGIAGMVRISLLPLVGGAEMAYHRDARARMMLVLVGLLGLGCACYLAGRSWSR